MTGYKKLCQSTNILLVMPLYFLSGGMFPISTAPQWMKTLMVIDPLTYGVDAIRNVVFSGTSVTVRGVTTSLVDLASRAGLIRWSLAFDLGIMVLLALLLVGVGAFSFSRAE